MSELLATMPDPTQDEVRGEGDEREKRLSERSSPKEDLADLAVNTSETELLSDIFGLDLRREGGQYKITPHNPNATLTELLNSPVPPSAPPPAPQPELRQRHQVNETFSTLGLFIMYIHLCRDHPELVLSSGINQFMFIVQHLNLLN